MTPTDSPETKKIEALVCNEPGSHPDIRNSQAASGNDGTKSKQGANNNSILDSDSIISGASTKKGLRQHLTEVTEPLMTQAVSILS